MGRTRRLKCHRDTPAPAAHKTSKDRSSWFQRSSWSKTALAKKTPKTKRWISIISFLQSGALNKNRFCFGQVDPRATWLAWGLHGSEKLKKRIMEGLLNGVASFAVLSFFSARATAITPSEQKKKERNHLRGGNWLKMIDFYMMLYDGGLHTFNSTMTSSSFILPKMVGCQLTQLTLLSLEYCWSVKAWYSIRASETLPAQSPPSTWIPRCLQSSSNTFMMALCWSAWITLQRFNQPLSCKSVFFKVCLKSSWWRARLTSGSWCGRTSSDSAAAGGFLSLWR